jgi:hypothetical protein
MSECGCDNDLEKAIIPKLKGKSKYKDAPRYPMIYEYEGEFKKNYSHSIKVMSAEIAKSMVKFVKEK